VVGSGAFGNFSVDPCRLSMLGVHSRSKPRAWVVDSLRPSFGLHVESTA
jgi:hypothetical protein